ncbi:MAG: tRNA (adenosine(37)-N6)-threonylcarbamoyltransferase complex ATPase subunit type 1 TsaE [Lachnospiraceae bacterium]|nr:tRNA (adenosine(37)-N6)-threonylcarbamoyltransferase complex ATPase subunit type 1 TsaE [Lachnospiraceae bacterium]
MSYSPEETFSIGERMGKSIEKGSIIALSGDLGTGKTLFTKGLARGLDIKREITSPTFNILKIYRDGRLPLYHFDVYRIGDVSEMDEIGYEDCFYGEGVSLVEWAELIEELLPENCIHIKIKKDPEKGSDYREIEINDCSFD